MVAALDDYSRDGGTHDCRAQWKKIYSGICDREHGRAQTGRIQLHPAVQGTLHEGGNRNSGETRGCARRALRDNTVSAEAVRTASSYKLRAAREKTGKTIATA